MQGRRRRQWPCIKAALMPEIKLGSNRKKSFLKVPTPIDVFYTDSARPRSTTSGEASLVWEDALTITSDFGQFAAVILSNMRVILANIFSP